MVRAELDEQRDDRVQRHTLGGYRAVARQTKAAVMESDVAPTIIRN